MAVHGCFPRGAGTSLELANCPASRCSWSQQCIPGSCCSAQVPGSCRIPFQVSPHLHKVRNHRFSNLWGSKGKGRDNESHSSLDTLMSHGDGLFSRFELCLWQAVIICELRHEAISTHKSISGIGFWRWITQVGVLLSRFLQGAVWLLLPGSHLIMWQLFAD